MVGPLGFEPKTTGARGQSYAAQTQNHTMLDYGPIKHARQPTHSYFPKCL